MIVGRIATNVCLTSGITDELAIFVQNLEARHVFSQWQGLLPAQGRGPQQVYPHLARGDDLLLPEAHRDGPLPDGPQEVSTGHPGRGCEVKNTDLSNRKNLADQEGKNDQGPEFQACM